MVVPDYNPSSQEAEAGGRWQPGLPSKSLSKNIIKEKAGSKRKVYPQDKWTHMQTTHMCPTSHRILRLVQENLKTKDKGSVFSQGPLQEQNWQNK